MALSKKHYEQFAYNFKLQLHELEQVHGARREGNTPSNVAHSALARLADKMARDFSLDNPRFDRERFLKACGF